MQVVGSLEARRNYAGKHQVSLLHECDETRFPALRGCLSQPGYPCNVRVPWPVMGLEVIVKKTATTTGICSRNLARKRSRWSVFSGLRYVPALGPFSRP